MKRKCLGIALIVACSTFAGSCARDDREVRLDLPLLGEGALPGENGSAGSGTTVSPNDSSAPRLAVASEAIDLGWVTLGFSARARIRVENAGTAPLPVPEVRFAQGSHADFSLIQNACATALAPGDSCELRVQLVPSESGQRMATLDIVSEAGGSASVSLSALGLRAGDLIMAPVAGSFEDFGGARVGSALEAAFSISNPSDVASGPLTFHVSRPEFELLAPGEGDCLPEATSLVGGQSCTLRVAFKPSERGPFEATLTGTSDGVGAVSVTLWGRGLLPAVLSASAPTVDFEGVVVLSSAQRSIQFENAGDEPLTLAGVRLVPEGVESFSILSSDCGAGTLLEGGGVCRVQLEFRPPRVGEETTAELVIEGTERGQSQSIGLRGIGLEPGALLVTAQTPGEDSFGEVLLGESSEHTFQIQNPSAQSSGVLELGVSEGFELATPPADGECVPGSTSLVNGDACAVRVRFVPSRREVFSGSFTVSSALAGAADLPLLGRGILPASLLVERELNFGRVLTGASGARTLSLENAGDQPLPAPTFGLSGNSPTQVTAFSFDSHCSAPLAFGERCDVDLTFAPTNAAAHAVTLEVASAAGSATVLLLGEAQLPGSLLLAAAAGSSPTFGDVPVGTSVTRAFTLQNPGQVAAGRLTISSDNNRFEPTLGDCNQGDPAGLVDGASCTFSVRFTPNDNLPQTANLSVQSPGAGRAGLQVDGRGRFPATLSPNGNRDLGRANIGQATLTQPQNEFSWVINNQGDLPTGTLTVQNDNGTEFAIRNDSCSGSAIPGRSSCQMLIRFQPSSAGNRAARVVVSDPVSASSVTLALTGLAVQLADLGESCVNATCAQGTCTRGVCCDVACDRTCQVCSAEGRCINQTNREACGNGAACFGVDNCKLPEGRACSANGGDAQCGSGNCERRLGGTGNGDRICCLDDCGNNLQCNTQNRCQAPALGEGEACGAAGQLACAAGLTCKTCRGGGSRCTPTDGCCGGCDSPLECSAGQCVCPVLSNGRRGIPCGGGVCAIDRQNACCPGSAPTGCNCDPADNLCKECLTNNQCVGANRVCNANRCVCSGCQIGQTCFASGAVDLGNRCQICAPFVSSIAFTPNVGAACGSGPSACSAQDTCNQASACQPNDFASGVTCNGGQCNGSGACVPLTNPFTCNNVNPPATVLPLDLYPGDTFPSGPPPAGTGGAVRNGRYVPTRVDVYGAAAAPTFVVNELTFEFRDGFVQVGYRGFVGTGAVLGSDELQFVGTATSVGSSLQFDVDGCDAVGSCSTFGGITCNVPASLSYSATANSLVTIQPASDGSTVVITYARQ